MQAMRIHQIRNHLPLLLGKEDEVRANDLVLLIFNVGNTQGSLTWLLWVAIPEFEAHTF